MRVENLIKRLKRLDKNKNIVIGNDEELNSMFDNVHIADLKDGDKDLGYVLYPNEQSLREDF